ncbi:Alpha/Beta hydrolase protein [Aspergillus flavus]|uniref:1-alkyl-2-acetylglycerophosphocholine esterase n=2 Tax=Aspergillus subgen. Circumdati TaxID=2720871 RepID=A0A5N6HDI3_ASPFL|nr:putative dienelactone hydrolase [Aspergillus oryzae 3.042]KAB8251729.1 Alpha/Beta hydrolase protein [Aspergillus flavus]KDE76279.1 putative dienelactone hydrolase [Aspergillus oryzae 100-8]|eukprot:EIT75885.1 putative dienelactone hydrolase [Aspergillus oryzae 3.042]
MSNQHCRGTSSITQFSAMAYSTIILLCAALAQAVQAATHLPGPSGPCRVQTTHAKLLDTSRVDPFSPTHDKRAIMATSYVPVNCGHTKFEPYLPPHTEAVTDQLFRSYGMPNGTTIKGFRIESGFASNDTSPSDKQYPVIIFSPGLGASRLYYSLILESVASTGFVVVSVDHPYDTSSVDFPDGSVIYGVNVSATDPVTLNTRVQDVIFTLDQIHDNPHLIPSSFTDTLELDRVAIVGHSFGGATAAAAMLNEPRFAGGLNFDGALWGPVVEEGLDRPFINFGHANITQLDNNSWGKIWPHLRGFRRELQLADSLHLTFTDFPLIRDVGGWPVKVKQGTEELLGSLSGLRVRAILTEYIVASATFFITGEKSKLLDGPSSDYPEVKYVA